MNAALRIAQTLDRHLGRPTSIVVFGTGALLLDSAFEERLAGRMTNDIDLIIPQDRLFRPQMLDLILSKMGRGDAKDLDDIRAMLALEPVAFRDVAEAVKNVRVPEVYAEIFPAAKKRILEAVKIYERTYSGPGTSQPESPEIDI